MSSSPPPLVFTAILRDINSPIFLMTSLRRIGWAPHRSRLRGRVETEAMCESRRSSKTEREDERDSERERVYRARREDKEGEGGKVDSSGGRPSRMRLPRMCVCLRVGQHRRRQSGGA